MTNTINTRISHKRGTWNENIVNNLRDGEIFYDLTGKHGIWMGVANINTGVVVPTKISLGSDDAGGGSGGITPEMIATFVAKADIVQVLQDGIIYDTNKVLGAQAGQTLADRIKSLETGSAYTSSGTVDIAQDAVSGKLKFDVKTNDTLGVDEETGTGLTTKWVSYA